MKTKKVVSVILLGAMVLSIAGCGRRYSVVSKKDFCNAIEDVVDLDDDEYTDSDYSYISHAEHMVSASDGDFSCMWIEFDSNKHAMDYFEDMYDDYQDMLEDDDFEGRTSSSLRSEEGYILLNGTCDSRDFFDDDVYGGVFCKEDVMVIVFSTSTSDRNTTMVNDFLNAIGYPHP